MSALVPQNKAAAASTAVGGGAVAVPSGPRLPHNETMSHAIKLSMKEDKPIMMDYWGHSIEKTVLIGVKENKEKLLVKSEEEYTSPIANIYKVGGGLDFIIITENSIYLVDAGIPTKRISA
jgi:hypothetical protein